MSIAHEQIPIGIKSCAGTVFSRNEFGGFALRCAECEIIKVRHSTSSAFACRPRLDASLSRAA
jgi:hypothetical protein